MKNDIRSFKDMKANSAKASGATENIAKEKITKEKAEEIFESFDENTKREAQTIEKVLKQYEGKSQSELMGDISRLASQERKKGNLDNTKLDNFARSVSPMLTKEQQARLSSILGQLKQ